MNKYEQYLIKQPAIKTVDLGRTYTRDEAIALAAEFPMGSTTTLQSRLLWLQRYPQEAVFSATSRGLQFDGYSR